MKEVPLDHKGYRYVTGIDFGDGTPSQTFYSHAPRFYEKTVRAVDRRKVWGAELIIDLRAATPGPEQKKYQKAQFELRKAKANGPR